MTHRPTREDGLEVGPAVTGEGIYAETRADDLVVRVIRELLRRNPALPADRVDEVAIAATTQFGDQGLTLGRTAALLAGLPKSVPGYSIDRMCAGAMTGRRRPRAGPAGPADDAVRAADARRPAGGAARRRAHAGGLPRPVLRG